MPTIADVDSDWVGSTEPDVDENRPRSKGRLAGVLLVLLVVAVAAGATAYLATGAKEDAASRTLTGSVTINNAPDDEYGFRFVDQVQNEPGGQFAIGKPCSGRTISSGYADLSPGADVVVKNEKGEIIATGALQEGVWIRRACKMSLVVADVPQAKFYEIEVGRRGPQRYSASELTAQGFKLTLTLGG